MMDFQDFVRSFDNSFSEYLKVGGDAAIETSSADLLQVVDTFSRPPFEEEFIDGHRHGVLANFGHYLITDGE
jgi:hypothetical protein